MSLIDVFRKFVGFKLLEYFVTHPSCEVHLKELARRVRVSPRSVKIYCDMFEREDIIFSERKGNLRLFRLNEENFVVKELKKTYYLILLKELGINRICSNCMSTAIYGSFAAGNFDEESDLDILVIGDDVQIDYELLHIIEEKIDRRIQLTIISFHKWEEMKNMGNEFALNVMRNHVLVKGVPL